MLEGTLLPKTYFLKLPFLRFHLGDPSRGGDLPPIRPGNIRGCFKAPLVISIMFTLDMMAIVV